MTPIHAILSRLTRCLLLGLLLQSCTQEDLSVCGLEVRFKYDYNPGYENLFAKEVDQVTLYVFDAQGIFVDSYKDAGEHLDNTFSLSLNLPTGVYQLVAWGNLTDEYRVTPLIPGVSHISDARLSLERSELGEVQQHPTTLYHASEFQFKVLNDGQQSVMMSLLKLTNRIKVTIRGLNINPVSRLAPPTYACYIKGINGDYNFDNSLATDEELTYIPKYTVEQDELTAEFVVLRLFPDGASRLILEERREDLDTPRLLLNESLPQLLLQNPRIKDLDRENDYHIEIEMAPTGGTAGIVVNGWRVVDNSENGGVVG